MYSIFRFSANTSFPGYRALIPCLGTALLIHCTGNRDGLTWMDRFLSVKPMVWVGKISYSLYLWHWPAIVFTKYAMGNQYGWVQQSWIVAIAFFAAYLSWKYVEQPFRVKDGRFKDLKSVLKPLGVVTALLLFISISGGFLTRGFPHRFSPAVVQYSNGSLDRNPDREHCHAIPLERIQSNDLCGMGVKKDGAPDFIVWGDSFADAMMPVFKKMAEEKGLYGLFASTSACAPIVGVNRKVKGLKLKCAAFNDAVMKVIHDFEIKNVVLVSGWAMSGYKSVNSANTQTELNLKFKKNRTTDVKNFYFGFDQTLSDLDKIGSKVWVVGMIPRPGFDIPDLLAKYEIKGIDRRHLEVGKGKYDWQSKGFNEVLTELAKKHSFELIDPTSILCPNNCIVEKDGRSLYYDKQHLSAYGARLIEPTLEPLLVSLNKH